MLLVASVSSTIQKICDSSLHVTEVVQEKDKGWYNVTSVLLQKLPKKDNLQRP